ncbi:hypothetical protein HNR42_002282 [Deinobacterium chartae]|uniref:Cysteine peptidase C11 family protein n=1 Tax=Deinobacterium chartae TaxID=521158 RepID=A0A841HZM5_9DEIO|nr:clostripain-related cysteine peptidase [Deinobacterium chartae]MBB6098847.1 hypothetical protein [Deinobacterium chartae]
MNTRLLALTALLLGAAHAQTAAPTWTIAVYVHADHNLDSSALTDLEEMQAVGSAAGFNIVYQLDRDDDEAGPGVERGLIMPGKRTPLLTLPEQDSDDPQVLNDFVRWAFETYPADRRAVILWDHGGQWNGGFGGDAHRPGHSEPGQMKPQDIARVLRERADAVGAAKLDFVAFDTCLMGGVELFDEFATVTDLYFADAELDYGDGWDYTAAFGYLRAHPAASARDFAQAEVAAWRAHHSESDPDLLFGVHAAYDLSAWPSARAALDRFARDLGTALPDPALLRARSLSVQYPVLDTFWSDRRALQAYVDLGDFARRAAAVDVALQPSAAALRAALERMVLARSLGSERQEISATSVWFPTLRSRLPGEDDMAAYRSLTFGTAAWSDLLDRWAAMVREDVTAPLLTARLAEHAGAARVELEASGDVASLRLSLRRPETDGTLTLFGDVDYRYVDAGRFSLAWDRQVWQVGDGKQATPVSAFVVNPSLDEAMYHAPAIYTDPDGDAFKVTVLFDADGIAALLDDSGISARDIDVEPGARLTFQLGRYDEAQEQLSWTAVGVVFELGEEGLEGLEVKRVAAPAGDYRLLVSASDYVGNAVRQAVDVRVP